MEKKTTYLRGGNKMRKQPEETEEYPVVGVLDTGIADIPYLAPWKEAVVHENYPKESPVQL